MGKFVYGVKNGRAPGVYETWEECKSQVHGFPGAVYKKFLSRKEAIAFVQGEEFLVEEKEEPRVEDEVVAYVDGSYDISRHMYSYGAVIFYQGEEVELNEAFEDKDMADMRNVAGEIMGAMAAMAWARGVGAKSLTIYHDYEGIAKWPLRQWKAKKEGTQKYVAYYDTLARDLHIRFVKVRAHSNDCHNDRADLLAKEALGLV